MPELDPAAGDPAAGGVAADDPQARDLPLDCHLHTNLSPDSRVPIDVYAAAAVERGIAEIAITDHLDFDPRAPAHHYATFEQRERSVREAAERWAGRGVTIHFGAELTWERAREEEIREHLARHAYDFTIGSVHVYEDSPYHSSRVAGFVAGRSIDEIVAPYFAEVEAAARSGLFNTLGHLDFVKRYLAPHVTAAMLAERLDLYEPILRGLIGSGTSLEVNVSGLRQASGETYPGAAVVARYRALGGERVTVGSDAHRPDWFTHGLADGYRLLAAAGFRALTFPRAGSPTEVPLPADLVGGWS